MLWLLREVTDLTVIAEHYLSAKTPLRTKGWFAYERRKNKCFTDEELKQLSKLAESATRYSMRENDIKGKNKEEGPWVTHGPEN